MKLYRVKKVAKPGGTTVRERDTLASNDQQAIDAARNRPDCPICEVWRDGRRVAAID
jgi:hypothetical protein